MLLRSLGSGVSGLKNFQTYLDVVANNISNVSTTGFKKGRINFQDAFSQSMQGAEATRNAIQVGNGSLTSSIDNIVSGGPINPTDNPYDFAISGEGYFKVQDASGAIYYTRAGDFHLTDAKELVNSQGLRLLGEGNTPIPAIPNDAQSFTVAKDGTITILHDDNTTTTLGQLELAQFNNPAGLEKAGNSLYKQSSASGAPIDVNNGTTPELGASTYIQQSALESSNVDLTDEMTELIEAQRAYQVNARTITTADQILQELVQLKR